MLNLIKNIFRMGKRPQRSESQDAVSKRKTLQDLKPRRSSSIDSKPKPQTVLKPHPAESFYELDSVNTIKKSKAPSHKSSQVRRSRKQISVLDFVSDIDDDDDKSQGLLTEVHEKEEEMDRGFLSMDLALNQNLLEGLDEQEENKRPSKALRKYLARPAPERKTFAPTLHCPFCSKRMNFDDSLRLVCLHRYHKDCAKIMRERNLYRCDLCDYKRRGSCSMVMMDRRRGRL